jgi:uncharacterized protein YdhG (YjbR/CyaY superfamily)
MARAKARTVDEYVGTLSPGVRETVEAARATIRKAVPSAGETISYDIVTFTLDGKPFLYLGGFARHISLYPVTEGLLSAVPEATAHIAGKGTMRFSASERLPLGLVRKIARAKAAEHRAAKGAQAAAIQAKKATARGRTRTTAQRPGKT